MKGKNAQQGNLPQSKAGEEKPSGPLPETNMALENGWFPFGARPIFRGRTVRLRVGNG